MTLLNCTMSCFTIPLQSAGSFCVSGQTYKIIIHCYLLNPIIITLILCVHNNIINIIANLLVYVRLAMECVLGMRLCVA